MEANNELINLYNLLKGEINALGNSNSRILLSLVASTGTILTFGLTKDINSLFFLSVYFFIIPLSGVIYGNRREIWKTSTYMRIYIEPKLLETKWETRLYALLRTLDKREEKSYLTNILWNETSLLIALNVATLLAVVISHYQTFSVDRNVTETTYTGIAIFLSLVGVLLYIIKGIRLNSEIKRGGKVEEWFFEKWKELRDYED